MQFDVLSFSFPRKHVPMWSAQKRLKTGNQPAFRNRIMNNYLNEEWIKQSSLHKGVLKPETACFFWFLHKENVATKDWFIVRTIPLFSKGEKVNFDSLPRSRGNLKNFKKGVEVWCRGRSSYKGGWHFFYLFFLRFISFTFRNYFTLCKIVLCYAFEEKNVFLPP